MTLKLFQKLASKTKLGTMMAALVLALALPVSAYAAPVDFSGTSLNIDPMDVIATGFNFMTQFNTYTTIVLGIMFAPVAIGFILWLWAKLPKMGKKKAD